MNLHQDKCWNNIHSSEPADRSADAAAAGGCCYRIDSPHRLACHALAVAGLLAARVRANRAPPVFGPADNPAQFLASPWARWLTRLHLSAVFHAGQLLCPTELRDERTTKRQMRQNKRRQRRAATHILAGTFVLD